ncbi:MAG: hypothetical protein IJA69_05960, partial [Clostridia bacterium]|nr:hypothetical protein [Clostridia bacterium]
MKFVTFLKIFAICFASLIGVFGVGIGVMYLAGTFTEPQIKPENIAFEYTDYDVTGDEFTVKVITTTPEVTLNELTLNLVTTADVKTTEQGTLTDGVIEIPKTAKIGEEIVVKICKTINDTTVTGESLGLDWITGGHSTISATSSNSALEPAKTNVHVDVPVYKIEVETRENIDDVNASSTFVIDSNFYANLKFYPERSAYQYSKDGNYGYEKLLKTAYFTLISSTNNKVTQIGQTNQFTTIKIGEGEKISGYCFTTTKMEKEVQKLYEIQDEATRFESVLNELKNEANKTNQVQKTALMAETTVSVVDIDVDTMKVDGAISDVYIDRETTIYASRTPSNAEQTASNLKIELSSSKEPNVPLQSKLKNVAVNFKVKIGTNVYEEATNADTLYNAIKMSAGGYGKVYEIDGFKYYSPVLTSNINNSYWKFTVDSEWAPESLIATIVYLDNGKISNIAQKSVSFSTISPSSSSISWKNTYEEEDMGINLKIYDDESVSFEEFNLTTNTLVPNENLYQTRKYFAYTNDAANLSQYIHCSPAVEYVLPGTQNNSYFLYEIPDGIIKAKSLTAHNLSFNVLFVTVEDDAYGQVKLDNGKYIIDQVSQTEFGLISSLRFYVTKTVKTLYGVVTPGEDTRYPYEIYPDTTPEDNSDDNLYADLAYVQNTANAFEVTIATKSTEEAEDEIFKQAISEEEIYVVAKIGDIESDIINISSITPSTEKGYTEYIFSINIGELPLGNQSNVLKLFIRYQKSSSVVEDLPIVTYNIGAEDIALENGIEVYDGAATYFEFGLSNAGYKTSIDNRLVVSSSLVGETVDLNGVILTPNISTTYMVDVAGVPTNVEADLFEDVEGAARIIKVLLQDKYKQQPINNTYTLKSTNQRIMLVAQSTITFLASGQAELELVDASGNTKDVIYFTSAQAGQVSNVSKLTYDVASGFEVESVYTLSETPYNFAPITINLVGATSLGEIYINSTTGGRNLVNMQYAVPGEDVDTLYDITGNLNWIVDDEVVSRYDGYIDFDIEHRMFSIIQEFGQSTSFSITLEIKELGISQQVTISIEPNVILRVAPSYHSSEGITDINRYSGVYAETPFVFGINIQRKVNSNQDLTYALFLMEKTDDGFGEAQQLTTVGEIAKIISGTESFVLSKEATSLSTQIEIQFASADQVKKYVLILKELTANDYDASISAYIYLLVNAKVEALEGIQFLVANSSTDLGSVSLENALPVSRIYGTQAIDRTQVTYELVSQTDSFSVVGTNLKSTKALDGVTDVKIKVSYCGYVLGTYTIKVAPDVQINGESGNFVLYNGENYFKLINQNKYTFASGTEGVIVADQFLMSGGVTITEINFDSLFNSNMYIVENPEEITDFFTVAITDRLVTSYSMVLKLSNGHYTTIKLILLPDNVPFVKYASETTQDLADMLSEDYLWQNYEAIHYELTGAGSEEGTQIIFEKAEFESKDYGMLKLSDNATIVIENQDEDDKLAYAWVEDNKLKTIAIGQDKYVMIKYALSNAEEALIVPYLVKIKAELSLQATYPYQVLANNEQTTQMQNVSKNNVVMEYLAFDDSQSPVATLDLNKKFSKTIPASAMADTRIEVLRYNVATGQNEVFDGEVDFKYEISSVYVYQAVIGWKEIADTATYANINEQGVLVVNQNRALKIRLSIKLTSENGLEGYYYVSCGEIPEYTLSEVTQTGVVTPGDNIEINNESPKDLSAYKLTITTSSTTEDYTSELKFYTPDDSAVVGEQGFVTIADGKLNAEKTVKPLQTNLVLYTKYGIVKMFNVGVKATYTATANQEQIVSAQEFDLTTIITIKDNTQTEITGWAIRDIEFNAQTYKFIKYQNGKLVIGAVDKDTDVEFNVTTNLAAEGPTDDLTAEVFNFKLTFTIVKSIVVADPANAINAPLNLGNVVATETKEISLFDAGIFKLCDGITNTTYHNEGIGHFELTITNGNNAIASTSLVQEDDKFDLITNQISTETQVNAVISYINDVQGFKQYNVYVVFVVKPNFEMIVTYPKAQEDGVSLGYEKFYIGNNETSDITGKLVFNLDSIHELSMVKRLQINAVDGKPLPIIQTKLTIEKADDGQDKVFVYANDTKMTDFETAQNTDTNFKFALVNSHTSSTITFSFYIGELQLSHTYVVKIYQNPIEVYETLGINLDALDKNSQTNSETIYVGENDTNLFSVVKVKYSIAQKLDETTYYKLYFGFKGEDGLSVEVEDLLIEVAPLETNGAINMVEIVLPNLSEIYNTIKENIINATSNVERNKWIELYCSDTPYYFVHVAENEEGEFEEVENSQLEVKAEGIETRIKLTYGSGSEASIVDFAKTYELILKNPTTLVPMVEVADGEETNTAHYVPVSVSRGELGNIEKLTSYYVKYLLDAEFKQTQMTIETNQTVSIVGTDGFVDENNNYIANFVGTFGLIKASNKTAITKAELEARKNINIEIDSVTNYKNQEDYEANNAVSIGYATYQQYKTDGDGGVVYDYLFLGQGAPKEAPAVVKIVVKISIEDYFKFYTLTLTVKHDYSPVSLKNQNFDVNS